MKTLIVYASNHGCTESCAQILSKKLSGTVELCNLGKNRDPVLASFDTVIIGGSIHVGKIQKGVSEFCTKQKTQLKNKKLGLFVCGMLFEKADEELKNAFPQELLAQAVAREFFGGEYRFQNMNFFDRMMVKKVAKVDHNLSSVLEENINRFIEKINSLS